MNKNNLSTSRYLISEELHKALVNEKLYDNNSMEKRSGIYILAVRLINKEKKDLIYNYIFYPYIFLNTLLAFVINKNLNSIRFKEWGDNLILLNQNLLLNYPEFKEENLIKEKGNEYSGLDYNDKEAMSTLFNNLNQYYIASDIFEVIRLITKLNFVTIDNREMVDILLMSIAKNYVGLVEKIIPNYPEDLKHHLDLPCDRNINIINSLIFIVRDLKDFTLEVKNRGYTINEGVQKWRGQINSMNALLNSVDMDYRTSLYNHNNYFVRNGFIDRKFGLDKSSFSFRNIHMNIGNVRWYSVKKKVYKKDLLTQRLDEKIESKKSFKSDSEIYLYLINYIRNSPINETTERNIENYLLSFYNKVLEDESKNKTSLIKYDLFSNIKVKNYIIESSAVLNDYLDNLRKRNININVKRVTSKLKSSYYLRLILLSLKNEYIVEMCLGILARIISSFNKIDEDTEAHKILSDLGDMLVNSYIYFLYKEFVQNKINIFTIECKKYLESANNLDKSLKDIILDIIHKLEKNKNLELYELRNYVRKILDINDLSKINFDNIDLILEYTLSDWKKDNKDLLDIYDNNLRFGIASIIIDLLKESDLIQENLIIIGKTDRRTHFVPSDSLSDLLKVNKTKNNPRLPLRVPMIVKPKLYSKITVNGEVKERLGGYLINDEKVTDPMIIPNWELKVPSVIQDSNVVYDLVNNLNSVGFKINKDLLEFISLHGNDLGLLLDSDLDKFKSKSKMTKKEYVELESIMSKIQLQENILGLAEVYSNVPEFYLPVQIDNRGRMNCVSQYLNYQSNELAKSLLLFSKSEKLSKNDDTAISYFKAYGANCFGNKLDKKSWTDRVKWINNNHEDILNYNNGNLISKADKKLLFTAFCIEYCKWWTSYNNIESSYFETHLPIQLDATCNGFQHLSLLIYDYDMGKELNLAPSSMEDLPKDYYGFIAIKLQDLIHEKLKSLNLSKEDRECYERLNKMSIERGLLKKPLMTTPYNVSTPQMIHYLKEHFIDISDGERKSWSNYDLIYQYENDPNLILCNKDISLIASGIREVLEKSFPRLKLLTLYLKQMVNIFNKLNLFIRWGTPSGLLANNSYTSSQEITLKPFFYEKSSFKLKMSTGEMNRSKQLRAFMPNLIHSLDAAALALLAKYHFIEDKTNFYAIHDCFAVTANNVEMLIKYLKLVYIKIYSEDEYLRKFHNEMLDDIKYHYSDRCYNPETMEVSVVIDGKEISVKIPDINVVLGIELPTPDLIKDSSYLIN